MKQRLIELTVGRRQIKSAVGTFITIPPEMVTPRGDAVYEVQSQSIPGRSYSVDSTIGMWTCTVGETGALQTASCSSRMQHVNCVTALSTENRRWPQQWHWDKKEKNNFLMSFLDGGSDNSRHWKWKYKWLGTCNAEKNNNLVEEQSASHPPADTSP